VGGIALAAICAAVWAAGVVAAEPDGQIAVVSKAPASASADWTALRTQGLDKALAGQFTEGLEQLRQAAKGAPSDHVALAAVGLLSDYLKVQQRADEEREQEYANARVRVEHCRIAQEYVSKAAEEELKTLREHVKELAKAYNASGTADELEDSLDKQKVEETKKRSTEALAKASASLAKVVEMYKTKSGRYAEVFLRAAKEAEDLLAKHLRAWRAVPTDDAKALRAAARGLKDLEYGESDVLGDLESMTLAKPWRAGLVQARMARRLAKDTEKLATEKWFVDLVAETEARGKKSTKEAEWYDALAAYIALKDLLPDNEEYQQAVKTVQRHVRVLGLYGRGPKGEEDDEDDEEPPWKEAVANVDADMVEKVIGQLDLTYVSSVDYRKVTRGGLMSVKVLAETPQVARSFEGLKDDAKRKKFLESIDQQLRDVERRDRVTHLDLILALNSVLRASEQTVEVPTEVLAVEFTDGFLDELDKFSSMIWPHDVPNFVKQTMGEFYGVGIQITKEADEPLRVVTPLIGTPAFRAGIKAGDLVVKVDGKLTAKLSIDKLVQKIMGEKGTKVVLTIRRGGRSLDVPIVRDRIRIRTVKGWQRKPGTGEWEYLVDSSDRIGYLRVTQFTSQTAGHMAQALKSMRDNGTRSVILDLRFNPGGLLSAAALVANEFLHTGRIVSTRGRRTRPRELNANRSGSFLDGDLIVLVNEHSASAAEIVSGALKDWKRARIIGQRTYGKGSVQNVIPIRRHSARLKLTTAYYYLPRGRLLHKKNGAKDWGVDPDIDVPLTPRQTRRWLDIRRKTDIVQDVSGGELREELVRQYKADVQLKTAVLMVKLLRLQERSAA